MKAQNELGPGESEALRKKLASGPKHGRWLAKNPKALQSVMAGIEEAKALRFAQDPMKKPSKYKNRRTEVATFFGKHLFDSKREADEYVKLEAAWRTGDIKLLLCQVPFRLHGGVKYVADFVVQWKEGNVQVYDVKGFRTDVYRLKKKQVEELYGVKIVEVR